MQSFVGMDLSLEESSICVIDERGLCFIGPVAAVLQTIQDLDPPRSVYRRTVISDVHNISSCQQGTTNLPRSVTKNAHSDEVGR